MDVRASYDATARAYADDLAGELAGKPLDRHLLDRFAEELRGRGTVADLGCGPGHIAQYLHERGVHAIGIDLAPAMIDVARERFPAVEYRVGDMTALELADGALAGAAAFYAIVHAEAPERAAMFRELHRVLAPGGLALIAFHAGSEVIHVEELYGARVELDFRFHAPDEIAAQLREAGLPVIERCERAPYPGVEYPSHRCYLLSRRPA